MDPKLKLSIVAFVHDAQGNLLLVKRRKGRPTEERPQGFEPIAGKVEKTDKTLAAAIRREVSEEIAVAPEDIRIVAPAAGALGAITCAFYNSRKNKLLLGCAVQLAEGARPRTSKEIEVLTWLRFVPKMRVDIWPGLVTHPMIDDRLIAYRRALTLAAP
jgi:8-oxo-dGTP pyrophosphatase MutT (NUDIX family)